MRWAAIALVLLGWAGAGQAQDRVTRIDCTVQIQEDRQWWEVDSFSADWLWWSEDRAQFRLTAFSYDDHYRHHLLEDGPFSRWGNNRIVVSPKTTWARGKLWARLDFDTSSLGPVEVSRSSDFFGVAFFPAHEVAAAMEASEAVAVTFYDRRSEIIDRYSVPVADIRTGAARLVPLFREYEARLAAPEGVCEDPEDAIVLTH